MISQDLFNTLPLVFKQVKKIASSINAGMSHQQIKILHLVKDDSRTVNELADFFQVSAPTISEAIDVLESKKLVTRVKSNEDRRVVKIRLTNLGKKEMTKAHKKVMTELDKKMSNISDKEKKIIAEAMKILRDNLN